MKMLLYISNIMNRPFTIEELKSLFEMTDEEFEDSDMKVDETTVRMANDATRVLSILRTVCKENYSIIGPDLDRSMWLNVAENTDPDELRELVGKHVVWAGLTTFMYSRSNLGHLFSLPPIGVTIGRDGVWFISHQSVMGSMLDMTLSDDELETLIRKYITLAIK